LFYPGGGVVDSLPCTILGSVTKRLKESDLVVIQPSKQLQWIIKFGNLNTTVWKSKNNNFKTFIYVMSTEEVTY